MTSATYSARRDDLETYFDRTAVEAWKRLTSDAPVGRVRATVRAGRDAMRATLLSWLPDDLRGARLLDAGCGTGALALEAARRGADVVAVDVSPTLIGLAKERAPRDIGSGPRLFRGRRHAGPARIGAFDFAVAMDSLIHYEGADIAAAVGALAERTRHSIVFTAAPRTPALAAMHAIGRLFPRGDRAPAIVPIAQDDLARRLSERPGLGGLARRADPARRARVLCLASGRGDAPMNRASAAVVKGIMRIGPQILPFADAATEELPLGRLLRLSLFQVTVGMAAVLLIGTLNRVMIVELGVPSWIVAVFLALPLLFAPLRTFIGFRSDHHRSILGWRRVPFIWFGTMTQFGGFAIMPFALLILSGDTTGPLWIGQAAAGLAFLLVGAGLHTVQTVGLALATDLAPERARPRVVALLWAMLLLGMAVSAVTFGFLLRHFSEVRLIQVVQGAAVVTMVLNSCALWKQEPRTSKPEASAARPVKFGAAWIAFSRADRTRRRLLATALGTAGFSMQDILLEPYGGRILHLPVGATTAFTALLAVGGGCGLAFAARRLNRGADPHRVAGLGAMVGVAAFIAVLFAAPAQSALAFGLGVALIGVGAGLFGHGTLTASMNLAAPKDRGLALGAWGAAQATAAGLAIAASGVDQRFRRRPRAERRLGRDVV